MITINQYVQKDGSLKHSLKKGERGILTFTAGKYYPATSTLAIMLCPKKESDVEILRWENSKKVDPKPVTFPLQVNIKLEIDSTVEQAPLGIHKYFTELKPELLDSGFGGEIEFTENRSLMKLAEGETVDEVLLGSVFDLTPGGIAVDLARIIEPVGGGASGSGNYKPAQTEADRIKHRTDYIAKVLDPTSPEGIQAALFCHEKDGCFDSIREYLTCLFQ